MTGVDNVRLKIPARMMSEGVLAYACAIGVAGTWIVILVGMLLVSILPEARAFSWLLCLPILFAAALVAGYFLQSLLEVRFEEDRVVAYFFDFPVRTIPVSELKLLCAVSSGRDDVLCLTDCAIEEMARRYEQKLLRGFLTRGDVPFRKRKVDWQEEFARGYIADLRKNPVGLYRQRNTLMVEMKPETQYLIRKMYPMLSYRNCTGVKSRYATRNGHSRDNSAIAIPWEHDGAVVAFEPDGLHLTVNKNNTLHISAQDIRTVVRVDAFLGWHRHYPHHLPLLLISAMTEEELMYLAPQISWDSIDTSEPNRQALLAMVAASRMALRYAPPDRNCCVVHYTENNVRKIRERYPYARFNDISACWLDDSDSTLS